MPIKSNKIYALISSRISKEAQISSLGGFGVMVDEYLPCDTLTPNLLKKLASGDTLIVANVILLGKNIYEVINTLNAISVSRINLCLAQENMSFSADKLPEIASSLLLAFKLHKSLISLRSRAALQEKKAQGIKLGRPLGFNPVLKLDEHKDDIRKMRFSGATIKQIAEKYHVCPATIYNLMHRYPELF